jgi:elongation factor Ts
LNTLGDRDVTFQAALAGFGVDAMKPRTDFLPADTDQVPEQVVLLKQPFIKNSGITVGQLITDAVAKMGENIKIRRFARYELGR